MNNSDKPAMPSSTMKTNKLYQQECAIDPDTASTMTDYKGLTKREHFAIALYAGMISATNQDGEWTGVNCADEAVRQADALLKELEK